MTSFSSQSEHDRPIQHHADLTWGRSASCMAALALSALMLSACGDSHTQSDKALSVHSAQASKANSMASLAPPLSAMAQVGAKAFSDPSLSAGGQQSCASCHASETGHAAPNALPVQPGGAQGQAQGLRNSQPLRYLARNESFGFDSEGKARGGFFWDGRANSLVEQAKGPLLNPREMANSDPAAVVAKIAQASWAGEFKQVFGDHVFSNVPQAFDQLAQAIAQFQKEDQQFNAYTSKFDAVLRGQASLTAQEQRGLQLFEDPKKGNCAACHTSQKDEQGHHPLFTDFSYDNLGVPRNMKIAENANPTYFDLGLCDRPDLKTKKQLCGAFKVPSLRNVALRKAFFHNGQFTDLRDVLVFYVQRDTHPEKWYPKNAKGQVQKFNDLPLQWHRHVSTEAPYDRKKGMPPALDESEIDAVLQFLNTLTDGWQAP